MTISSSDARTGPYAGNDATTVFSYDFRILDETHIQVILTDASGVETVQTLTTHYTVSGVDAANGGNVTMLTPPATGETLTFIRIVPLTQAVDYKTRGAVQPNGLERALDKLTQIDQDQQEDLARALLMPASTDLTGIDLTLPAPAANELIGWNATATGWENKGTVSDISIVAASIASVNTVAANIADVNTVATDTADVSTVAGSIVSVATVALDIADVSTVATDIADVSTVATNIADVTTVAANVADVTNFADVYIGPSATNPTQRADTSALQTGDLYFNTTSDEMRVYNGSTWQLFTTYDQGLDTTDDVTFNSVSTSALNGGQLAGRRNMFRNGFMAIAQRSDVTSSGSFYGGPDRWAIVNSLANNMQLSQYAVSTPSPYENTPSLRAQVSTTDTPAAAENCYLRYRFEDWDVVRLWYGRTNAKSSTIFLRVRASVAGDYNIALVNTPDTRMLSWTVTLAADTWTDVTLTVPGDTAATLSYPSGITEFEFRLYLSAGTDFTSGSAQASWVASTDANQAPGQVNMLGTASATFFIESIQWELGDTATEFEHLTLDEYLTQCMRYYRKYVDLTDRGHNPNTTAGFAYIQIALSPPMRTDSYTTTITVNANTRCSSSATVDYDSANALAIRSAFTSGSSGDYVLRIDATLADEL